MTGRIILIFLILLSGFGLILLRLFYWQVVRFADLSGIAIAQSSNSLELPARRGEIRTSDGFPIATNKVSYLLYANPKQIKDSALYAHKLTGLTNRTEATLSAQLTKDFFWVKLAEGLDSGKKKNIEDLSLKGLGFAESFTRYYPEASLSAHLLGFVGRDDSGRSKGYFGVEGYYDTQLSGRDGRLFTLRDARGQMILNDTREEKKTDGRNLTLTIDRTIQFIAERELKEAIDKYGAEAGNVIVMEPTSGKVLAMASDPSFSPQDYYDYEGELYKNPVISSVYEPGSTFKVLIMASAIDSGVVRPDTRCPVCDGPVAIGEYKIKTWNDKYYPNSTMAEVIQHSDNTGMVFVGQKLGATRLLSYLHQFGIGDVTGIDLQGEISGNLKNEDELYPIDLATITFGQGISITPMQLTAAVSSIANGGSLVTPFVVGQIENAEGKSIGTKPVIKHKVISSATANIMKEMMVRAVDLGESKWVSLKNYKIAGKTGTAQIPVAGRYDPNQTIASFIGFFPADKPQVIMLVTLTKPQTSTFGSETAAPVFFSIARQVISHLNIPPDR